MAWKIHYNFHVSTTGFWFFILSTFFGIVSFLFYRQNCNYTKTWQYFINFDDSLRFSRLFHLNFSFIAQHCQFNLGLVLVTHQFSTVPISLFICGQTGIDELTSIPFIFIITCTTVQLQFLRHYYWIKRAKWTKGQEKRKENDSWLELIFVFYCERCNASSWIRIWFYL